MAEESNVVELTNVAARLDCITKGFDDLYTIEEEIVEKTEKHIKGLRDLKTKTWRNLRKDVDIPRKVLDLQYRQYKAIKDAAQGGGDEFDALIDHLREIHLALHAGETIDWVKAIEA